MNLFTANENDIELLQNQWNELLSCYTPDTLLHNNTFRMLRDKYSERTRLYHNLSHIKLLLELCETLRNQIKEHDAVRFSIWFHDSIYDTKRNDNEEESAELASRTLHKLHVNDETISFVKEMILATRDHKGCDLSEDARLFLDMDLAILGMSRETYDEYSKAIRREYSWVTESTYRTSRRKILESFVDRERIYFTEVMQKRFEEQARRNIKGEIRSLEA